MSRTDVLLLHIHGLDHADIENNKRSGEVCCVHESQVFEEATACFQAYEQL